MRPRAYDVWANGRNVYLLVHLNVQTQCIRARFLFGRTLTLGRDPV